MADVKCYLFDDQDHIVKRCDLSADDLNAVVASARAALGNEASASKFEIWQGARMVYTEHIGASHRTLVGVVSSRA